MREVTAQRPGKQLTETVSEILHAHRTGTATPVDTVARSYERIRAHNDPAVFISLRDEAAALAEAKALMAAGAEGRPLYGIPVAIKDNIDAEGMPTTAACPAFAYKPGKDATAVARLRHAGAVVIGKTNLDQFATGLVGTRSPYGIPRNALNPKLIPGGSSSLGCRGSRASSRCIRHRHAGQAARRRAEQHRRPCRARAYLHRVVSACRSLDCVSIRATTDDCWTAFAIIAGPMPIPIHALHRASGWRRLQRRPDRCPTWPARVFWRPRSRRLRRGDRTGG